ncbi:TlpA disulfide reductase family protein [uncultured Aquimarina sp.]|uniref:TlpA family protein disulfide reductase n=1 Tax=uncultured Aquimarina sp. TaxID=575652 RepID=UPI0026174967|nr:TlpA disulfide reductase family protein [uncultured Aquimarina sp.]
MKIILISICVLFISCNTKEKNKKDNLIKNQIERKEQRIKKANVGDKVRFLESLFAKNLDFDISSLEGKTLYIDNWATWCAPCMKSNKKFVEKYDTIKNIEDIVFVFVSFDSKEKQWRDYIEKNFPKSKNIIHLYSGFKMDNDYSDYYGINILPAYFSIDEKGSILSLTAPSASDEDFVSYLKSIM